MLKSFLSSTDNNILSAMWNNKLASAAGLLWLKKMFNPNTDPRTLEMLADIMIMHDHKDIGLYDHLHHWLIGYLMKSLSQSKNLPPNQRKAKIIQDLSYLANNRKRNAFIRGQNNGRRSKAQRLEYKQY
ncbi:MAG: hypothetical protein HeimC3_55160 [Candidatus Heimdallarchaeota archaeon LC_3]|nr:MAG: hypothetical protein HeimC3_55160 [Candidatus Heimdallarchaeota archaeon LC_3]